MPQSDARQEPPDRLTQLMWGFASSQILLTAVELEVFTALAKGCRTAKEVARAVGASERGVRILLDALVALELLNKAKSAYHLSPLAAERLVRGRRGYQGNMIRHVEQLRDSWMHLTDVVRSGTSPQPVQDAKRGPEFFPSLADALFARNYPHGCEVAEALGVGTRWRGLRVLDVACGATPWSIPFAERDQSTQVVANDFPSVLKVAKRYAQKHRVAEQFAYLPGNLREVDFGAAQFDAAILGHICHSEGARWSRALLRRMHRALKPGGKLLIAEVLPNDERTGATWALLFAVNMLVQTEEGDAFTMRQYRRWLKAAGFVGLDVVPLQGHSPILVANK